MSFWLFEYRVPLKTLVEAGLSASQIAGELSVRFDRLFTRNSVISKVRREKLELQGNVRPGRTPKPKTPRKPTASRAPVVQARKPANGPKISAVPYVPVETNIPPGTTPLLELGLEGCKWPSGDGPFAFCNRPQAEGLPYCPGHAALAYRAPEARRR